ncbi:MAG: hypothetical protein AABX83_01050 [Nanoarchaeota archaeon]
MGFLDWWFYRWKPEKYKWYSFHDNVQLDSDINLNFKYVDRLRVKPYAYIKGKKYRAKFFITNNYSEIIAGRHKIIVPIKRCSFRCKHFNYDIGQSITDEYYITIVTRHVSKEDYDRYNEFKIKKR